MALLVSCHNQYWRMCYFSQKEYERSSTNACFSFHNTHLASFSYHWHHWSLSAILGNAYTIYDTCDSQCITDTSGGETSELYLYSEVSPPIYYWNITSVCNHQL